MRKISLVKYTHLILVALLSASIPLDAETSETTQADQDLNRQSINTYLDRLDLLEEQYGAYEPELAQELASLANLYQANGQHREAVAAFKRQYQIARTNDGLYSMKQADTLKKMIVSLIALREWEEVENRHYFLQQLTAYNYPENDVRKLVVLNDMANWHLYAYSQNLDQKQMLHLLTARNAMAQAGQIMATNKQVDLEQVDSLYGNLLYTDYQIAMVEQQSAVQAQSRAAFEQRVRADFYNNTRATGIDSPNRMRAPQNSFVAGVRHLEDLRNVYANNPAAPAGATASVDAQIGDWYSLWQKINTANSYYVRAWQALSATSATANTLNETFGEPVRLLHFVDDYEAGNALAPGKKEGYVLFDLTVNEYGRVKDLTILENEPASRTREISRAGQSMTRARYRPRYENGMPVATTNVQVRYVFEYQPDAQ